MAAHDTAIAAMIASLALTGAAGGAVLGLRRAKLGKSLLNAPISPDDRRQLQRRGRGNFSAAVVAFTILIVISLALVFTALAT